MPESDVTKMKVADLKRELKVRGLSTTGNKNELQDRLQTALIEGDISLDDAVITDDVLEEDVDLTDEDENKLLVDENELLKSPISTPTTADLLLASPGSTALDTIAATGTLSTASTKKIVLKRENSIKLTSSSSEQAGASDASLSSSSSSATSTTKENAAPTKISTDVSTTSTAITSGRKPIIAGDNSKTSASENGNNKKITQLSMEERLQLRAKRFGVQATPAASKATAVSKTSSQSILANKGNKDTEEKQIEALKRRAERFGCVVSEKLAKQDANEKLLKRKERFGLNRTDKPSTDTTTSATAGSSGASSDVWAEKARARLERFKVAAATTNASTAETPTSAN